MQFGLSLITAPYCLFWSLEDFSKARPINPSMNPPLRSKRLKSSPSVGGKPNFTVIKVETTNQTYITNGTDHLWDRNLSKSLSSASSATPNISPIKLKLTSINLINYVEKSHIINHVKFCNHNFISFPTMAMETLIIHKNPMEAKAHRW